MRRHIGCLTVVASLACLTGALHPLTAQSRRTSRAATAAPPAAPAPSRSWSFVSSGGSHTCALDATGRGYCWGENTWRRLGITDSVNQRRAVAVETPQRFRSIHAGALETCAVTAEGAVVCWGGEQPGTPPHSSFGEQRFRVFDLAGANGCGVTGDGVAWCWGSNNSGQLGSGRPTPARSTAPERVAGNKRWQSVVAGNNYGCGLVSDASAWCWGVALMLGSGAGQSSNVPVPVAGGRAFRQITAGDEHVCAVTLEGAAWCWGSNSSGQLGYGQTPNANQPVAVAGNNLFKELAAGNGFTCGLTNQGRVYCWGSNQFGTLGTGDTRGSPIPVRVAGEPFLPFTSISAGASHVCGVAAGGGIYCWGDNSDGALGIARSQTCRGTVSSRAVSHPCAMVPTRIQDPR